MPELLKSRNNILIAVYVAVLVFFTGRMLQMQLIQGDDYESQIYKGTVKAQTVPAARGEILDRYGNPIAMNRVSLNIVLDKAFLPAGQQNQTILELISLLEQSGEEWLDDLPVSRSTPYTFEGTDEKIAALKKFTGVNEYADAQEVMHWLIERFDLDPPTQKELEQLKEGETPPPTYTAQEQRYLVGVLYTMERKGYNLSAPYTFAEDISVRTATIISEERITSPGVTVEQSTKRYYPCGSMAAHIVGITGSIWPEDIERLEKEGKAYALDDIIGKSGLEKLYEDDLRGADGERLVYVNENGEVTASETSVEPRAGNNILLTIDSRLQQVAEQALMDQIFYLNRTAPEGKGKEANAGAVCAIDIRTGEVLVLASYPSYDINTYYEQYAALNADTVNKPLYNRALYGTYTPGSIFKPVVALAGLMAGEIDRDSTVTCARIYTHYASVGFTPTCLGYHGDIDVVTALKYSCNIFFYDVGRRVGIDAIEQSAKLLGLGVDNGFELSTSIGVVSTPAAAEAVGESWNAGDVLQSSIGQRFNKYSPLQLATYCMNIANRGTQNRITILKSIRDYSMSETLYEHQTEVLQQSTVDPALFDPIFEGMVAASRTGTAADYFGSYPVDVASKTGTPETADLPNSTFICFAPADDPQIAISVVIEKGWHGYTGAPVAKAILDAYFSSDMTVEEGAPAAGTLIR